MSDNPGKYACDLKAGDVVLLNGVPTDIVSIERDGAWVKAWFSERYNVEHRDDSYRWLSFTWVPVISHVAPGMLPNV